MYSTNNFRYLRVSKASILPLNLLLAKEDLTWFNDYSFQEILSVLKPLLLSRIELYNRGHIVKRSIAPSTYINIYKDQDDGLEDAGVILGGDGAIGSSTGDDRFEAEAAATMQPPNSIGNKGKRRRGMNATGGGEVSDRPQFCVRFGMRPSTTSERGAILVAEKNLGFSGVKREQLDEDSVLSASGSQRLRMDLAELEGQAAGNNSDEVVIRQEDESDSLRVSDFHQAGEADDAEYVVHSDKGKQPAKRKSRGKRVNANKADAPSSQVDQKPTLQVAYDPLKLHPQTLYIVVRTLGTSTAQPSLFAASSVSSESAASPSSAAIVNRRNDGGTEDLSTEIQEDEESLFPPGMDYFQE